MTYAYPSVPDLGTRLKTLLAVFREAGGKDACVLVHDLEAGREAVRALGKRAGFGARGLGKPGGGRGLPARVIPLRVLPHRLDRHRPAARRGLLRREPGRAARDRTRARGLHRGAEKADVVRRGGAAGPRLQQACISRVVDGEDLENQLWNLQPAATVAKAATFNLSTEKRTSLDFAFDFLSNKQARRDSAASRRARSARSTVNKDTCTLCKACIGACPGERAARFA